MTTDNSKSKSNWEYQRYDSLLTHGKRVTIVAPTVMLAKDFELLFAWLKLWMEGALYYGADCRDNGCNEDVPSPADFAQGVD